MISVDEARNLIFSQCPDWGAEKIPLVQCAGRVLAEDVFADRDFPPFDRVTMDGIALSYEAFASGQRVFEVVGTQLAGEPAQILEDASTAIEIMTGAMLAQNCDIVIRYEDLEFSESDGKKWVEIAISDAFLWKNIHRQSSDLQKDKLLIEKGSRINANLISILATVGMSEVLVKRFPKIAVIATGDELVNIDQMPAPYQIRKSNTASIEAELINRGVSYESFHLLDNRESLKAKISEIIDRFDVLLMSGGVSKGKVDYLPEVLDELKVEKLFHRVAQRPGKPFWFGVSPNDVPVFAFPGNPISTLMCFNVYFLKWLDKRMGVNHPLEKAILKYDFSFKPSLDYFLQVSTVRSDDGQLIANPEIGNGSGDIVNLTRSDAFLHLPAGRSEFQSGEKFDIYSFTS